MASPPYSGPWRRIRVKILERDGYECQIRGAKCTWKPGQRVNQVDHIVSTNKGGSWWDESNLRASCGPCNRERVDSHASNRWQHALTSITLVVGPPGPAMAAYVDGHKGSNDLVVDYDAIARSLGTTDHDTVNAARSALIRRISRGECNSAHAWITSANPHAESVLPYHHRVVVDVGHGDAVQQAHAHGIDAHLVHEWYLARSSKSIESKSIEAVGPSRHW